MPKLMHADLTYTILGAYFEVYNHTWRTYPESTCEGAMLEELRLRNTEVTSQVEYRIMYKGKLVGIHRLDLLVAQEITVELKVVEQLTALHKAQGISYLKVVDKPVGLLLNFGSSKPEFNRLYFNQAKKAGAVVIPTSKITPSPDWLYPDLAYQIVGGLYEVFTTLGAGFVHRIYTKACYHEFGLRGLATQANKRIQVVYKGTVIDNIAFGNLVVEGKVMVFPVAIGDIQNIYLDNLKTWMSLNQIKLGILANFDAVPLDIVYIRV